MNNNCCNKCAGKVPLLLHGQEGEGLVLLERLSGRRLHRQKNQNLQLVVGNGQSSPEMHEGASGTYKDEVMWRGEVVQDVNYI